MMFAQETLRQFEPDRKGIKMATFEARLDKLEARYTNRPLSSLSDDELNARIIQLLGYLPSEEELSESAKVLRQEFISENLRDIE